jgi:prevent-host-death family protein
MIDLREIYSLTDFQRNAKQYIERTKETQKPIVLTVNGKAEVVVQDAHAYQQLLEYAETVAAIRKGIEEFERGQGKPAQEALEELRAKHGIAR